MNYQKAFEAAFSYEQYMSDMLSFKENSSSSSQSENPDFNEYTKMGYARMKRINKTAKLSTAVEELCSKLPKKIHLLAITESWCGDSGQNLPYFNLLAESFNCIDFKLVYREENPELMEAHLFNGTKSIPIVIFLDENFVPIGQWGPRPSFIQKQVKEFRSKDFSAEEYSDFSQKIQRQYNQDGGTALYNEVYEILASN